MNRADAIRIVVLSDTHGSHEQLSIPHGDVLVHAGDLTRFGGFDELRPFNQWLGTLPHRHKLLVAGNHDVCFENDPDRCREILSNAHYLQDQSVSIEGLKFYGSPWQPRFLDWAFNLDRGAPLREAWNRIPNDTDVLVTHCPPNGILDVVHDGSRVGCEELRIAVERIRPRAHLFGHIHEGAGTAVRNGTHFANAAICDVRNMPVREPTVITLPRKEPRS